MNTSTNPKLLKSGERGVLVHGKQGGNQLGSKRKGNEDSPCSLAALANETCLRYEWCRENEKDLGRNGYGCMPLMRQQ